MAELKTQKTEANVQDFINAFADSDQKRKDSFELLDFMKEITVNLIPLEPALVWR